MKVYQAINAVQAKLAQTGITKGRTNTQQNYKFRSIDDVFNALSPLLAHHNLCILPRVLNRQSVQHQTSKGGTLFYVVVEMEFDLVCSEDGSKHTIKTFGEAMDSGDKATNKAMSAAYKYAAIQAFAIPTEGDNDSDAHSPEVVKNDGYAEFEEAHLDACRGAAMNGLKALNAYFVTIPAGEMKERFWQEHSDALKSAAAKVK